MTMLFIRYYQPLPYKRQSNPLYNTLFVQQKIIWVIIELIANFIERVHDKFDTENIDLSLRLIGFFNDYTYDYPSFGCSVAYYFYIFTIVMQKTKHDSSFHNI